MYFAWAGALEPGQGHYYRVQTAKYLFEYDNTQNNANHIHAVRGGSLTVILAKICCANITTPVSASPMI
jgi:hypothetical protein